MTRKTKSNAKHVAINARPPSSIKKKTTSVLAAAVIASVGSAAIISPAIAEDISSISIASEQQDVTVQEVASKAIPEAKASIDLQLESETEAKAEPEIVSEPEVPVIDTTATETSPVVEEVAAVQVAIPQAEEVTPEFEAQDKTPVEETPVISGLEDDPETKPDIQAPPVVNLVTPAAVDDPELKISDLTVQTNSGSFNAGEKVTGTVTGTEDPAQPVTVELVGPGGSIQGVIHDTSSFTIDTSLDLLPGSYTVKVTRGAEAVHSRTIVIVNAPEITVSVSSIPQGGGFTAFLKNFEQGEPSMTLNGVEIQSSYQDDEVSAMVPTDFTPGTHILTVTRGGSTASTELTVTPAVFEELVITSNGVVSRGDNVEGTISGVDDSGDVLVELIDKDGDSVLSQTLTPDGTGSFNYSFQTGITIPIGTYTVKATQGSRVATTKVVIVRDAAGYNPEVSITSPVVNANDQVYFTGKGFVPGETIRAVLTGPNRPATSQNVEVNSRGEVDSFLVTDFDFASGTYTLTLVDRLGTSVSATFEVIGLKPVISTQSTVVQGDSFTLSGTGYIPNSQLQVDAGSLGQRVVQVDPDGNFKTTFQTSNDDLGLIKIKAYYGGDRHVATTTITVVERTYSGTISVTSEAVPAGGRVTVTGGGFRPNSTVSLITETNGVSILNVDRDGKISAFFDIPENESDGIKTLLVIAEGNIIKSFYTVKTPVVVPPVEPPVVEPPVVVPPVDPVEPTEPPVEPPIVDPIEPTEPPVEPPVGPVDPGNGGEVIVPPVGPIFPPVVSPIEPGEGTGEVIVPPTEKPKPPVDVNQNLNQNLGSAETVSDTRTTAPTGGLLDLYGTTIIPQSDATATPKEPKKSTSPTAPSTTGKTPSAKRSESSSESPTELKIGAALASDDNKTSSPIGWIAGGLAALLASLAGAWYFLIGKKRREEGETE